MRDAKTYEEFETKRSDYSKMVLDSLSPKIIVMAGPGTGKSFLFKQVANKYRAEGKDKIIVLSFINELVNDLMIDMHGLAEVSTLHRFAFQQLKLKERLYMRLLDVIEDDIEIETGDKKDLSAILHNLNISERPTIEYMRARRGYYASLDASGAVFELVNYYKANPTKVPQYDLILVDEYQDFNLLEVELINILSVKNNLLIAGDDDQSLYSFKHSVPDNIRQKHAEGEYEAFELPYCSRSTEVVIDAFHDVVKAAKKEGHMSSRIEKEYLYFPTQDKDRVSKEYPTITVKLGTQYVQNAYYIDADIVRTFEAEPKFDVLIICPLKKQINSVGAALRKMGYRNISGDGLPSDSSEMLIDGLSALLDDKDSNLGWRLCTKALMSPEDFSEALLKTADRVTAFKDATPVEVRSQIRALRAAASKLQKGQSLDDPQRQLIFEKLDIDVVKLGEKNARERLFSRKSNKVYHDTKIKITTILGSKGLSYDHVFMINFDDRYLHHDGINDEKVNMFLVALTRSKKKISIFTSQDKEPTLVSWIDQARKKVTRVAQS